MSNAPVLRFGSHGYIYEPYQFNFPSSVACNDKGDIIVVDKTTRVVKVFDKHGKFSLEAHYGEYVYPVSVAVDHKNGNEIVVVDTYNLLIQIFNEEVKPTRTICLKEKGSETFTLCSIAVDQRNDLYYVIDSQRVRVFERFGTEREFKRKFDHFWQPFGIGILSNGNVVISEPLKNRLQVFTPGGVSVRAIGQEHLSDPHHIYVDFDDHIWVADSGNNQVKAFNQEGDLLKVIGDGVLVSPYGVCMDNRARVVVSEGVPGKGVPSEVNANTISRISIFRPSPELWTTGTVIWWIGAHKDLDSTVCDCAKKYSWNGSTLLDLYDESKKGADSFVTACSEWGISDGPTRTRLKSNIKKLFEDA